MPAETENQFVIADSLPRHTLDGGQQTAVTAEPPDEWQPDDQMATARAMPRDLAAWLHDLGLDKYHDTFAANDVDLRAVPYLTDADLLELGVSLGHRRIMLAAIAALSGASAASVAGSTAAAAQALAAGEGERRLVSVFFCDMVGSTELSRRLDPEDLRQLLRAYQECVAGAVAKYGGHLAQYLGDGVMAYFGWPTAYEDQAERAVRAGLDAIDAVKGLEAGGVGPIRSRIAIATGEVVIGDLSVAGRQEGAIAGETPNFAARLQQCAEPDQLVISEETRSLIGAAFEVTDCGRTVLKGFEGGVRFYRVDGVREAESRFDVMRGQSLSRFVGRTSEFALVLEKWELAKSGEGQVALVSGDAGIGKSRFVRAVADALGNEPHTRWQVQCSPYHTASALFPVIQSLNRALDFQRDDGAERRRAKLAEFIGQGAADAVLPVLAELLSIGPTADGRPDETSPAMSPQDRKVLALSSLVERFVAMAEGAPLLLVVEDAHWIDPTTLELVEQLVARIATARVLLLVLHRPEWGADWSGHYGHVTSFTLGRLSRPQVAELVRDLMGPDTSDELVGEIAVRTDGVPMFVEEVARSIVEAGPQKSVDSLLVPATLQGALVARLDALRATSREVVQAAAVMGREFHPDVIGRVCDVSRDDMDATLDELSRARLVTRSGADALTVTFRHALIQDVAYQSLLRSKRRQLHQAVADALIEIRPETAETQPELLAHHLSEAGAHARALSLWLRAGERAIVRYANDEAVRHYEKGLEACSHLPAAEREATTLRCLVLLGGAQRVASQLPLAMGTFQQAADLARTLRDSAAFIEAALGYDHAEFASSEPTNTSRKLVQEALSLIGEAPDSHERCRLLLSLTRVHIMSGESDLAEDYGRRTAAMARRLGDPQSLAEVLIHGMLVPQPGYTPAQFPDLEARLDELRSTAQRVDNFDLNARVYATCYYRWTELGLRDRMDEIYAEWSAWGDARNNALIEWLSQHIQAMLATLDGDLAAAEAHAEQAVKLGRRSQGDQAEGVYGMQMFTIRREQSRLAEVAPVVKRLLGDARTRAVWQPGFALIASELGYHDAARRLLGELAEGGFAFPRDAKRSTTIGYLAEVCAAVEDRNTAQTRYGLLEPYANMTITAGVATMCYGAAQRHLGLLAETLEAWDLAEEHFEAALVLNEKLRAPLWLAHTRADFSRMLRRRGRGADAHRAESLHEQALTAAGTLGLSALTAKLRRSQN